MPFYQINNCTKRPAYQRQAFARGFEKFQTSPYDADMSTCDYIKELLSLAEFSNFLIKIDQNSIKRGRKNMRLFFQETDRLAYERDLSSNQSTKTEINYSKKNIIDNFGGPISQKNLKHYFGFWESLDEKTFLAYFLSSLKVVCCPKALKFVKSCSNDRKKKIKPSVLINSNHSGGFEVCCEKAKKLLRDLKKCFVEDVSNYFSNPDFENTKNNNKECQNLLPKDFLRQNFEEIKADEITQEKAIKKLITSEVLETINEIPEYSNGELENYDGHEEYIEEQYTREADSYIWNCEY